MEAAVSRQEPSVRRALLKRNEVADVLGVSLRTVERMLASGELRCVRVSQRTVRIYYADVVRYVETRSTIAEALVERIHP